MTRLSMDLSLSYQCEAHFDMLKAKHDFTSTLVVKYTSSKVMLSNALSDSFDRAEWTDTQTDSLTGKHKYKDSRQIARI